MCGCGVSWWILLRLLKPGVTTAAAAEARYGSHLIECPDVHTLLTFEGADRQPLEALQQWERQSRKVLDMHSQDVPMRNTTSCNELHPVLVLPHM
jgi:hypothetical protein